jgi:hypothetical protein
MHGKEIDVVTHSHCIRSNISSFEEQALSFEHLHVVKSVSLVIVCNLVEDVSTVPTHLSLNRVYMEEREESWNYSGRCNMEGLYRIVLNMS